MTSTLSETTRKAIAQWAKRYPPEQKRSAILEALRIVQEENGGSLTTQLMDAVAKYLELPKISVYEVATFYTLYDLQKTGTHKILLCTNVSCMLCGVESIANHLKKKLEVEFGETTKDGKFSLKEVECLAACGGAPAMQIDKTYYENLTPAKIDKILDTYA